MKLKKISLQLVVLLIGGLFLLGCSGEEPTRRELGAATGAAVGAGLGAIVGHQTGHAGEGVAIGAAAGALTGAVIGGEQDTHEDRVKAQEEVMRRQQEELERQRREIEDLKRQQEYNDSFKVYERPKRERGSEPLDRNDSFSY